MPKINKTKKKKIKKAIALKTVKSKPKSQTKNTLAYYQCMKTCCKDKKISQAAHECKTNALAINAKLTAEKVKAIKKVSDAYKEMGIGLKEFIKAKN